MSTATRKKPQTGQDQLSIEADRLIIATNRGPVEYFKTKEGQIKSRRGSGGVVTALTSTVSKVNSTWVALAMTEGDREALKSAEDGVMPSPIRDIDVRLRYVTVPKTTYRKHYDMMSNRVLWFTQHYLLEQGEDVFPFEKMQDIWNKGYYQVNKAIADAVGAEITSQESKALVMLHDYHLYLASGMIRQQHPSVAMQQFIHIPWPEHRYWASSLPTEITKDIFRGLLGNDILGFQTRGDAHNFLEGVHAFVDDAEVDLEQRRVIFNDHQTFVRDYPISISVSDERRLVRSNAGKHAAEKIKPLLNKYTLMRVDRIEPTKNIVQGFLAYETLLEQHPELHGQTTFLAFLIPSRQSLPLYREYHNETMKVIEEINKKYGTKDWEPIHTFVQNDRTTALAALQFYDVLLVNSVIDGMNLVAKEGAAVNTNDGVLVLSRTSGAFQQLENASIAISPASRNETADALYKALMLPREERKLLAERARHEVETDDLRTWMTQQINDVNDLLHIHN
ncbi:alpha,alpha-trehalose-phosphate synthase (UDP-forming) [Dictyobacter formicarum]|uniref:Trehalose-6-phosphate synthase n=1 Tax=Dictyobacter formicarum TaxID=2778368 RepID=A0ABQ3VDB7_9CHLR|nr:trehalose-6-phosphate synthase [Dictyobacter formicarum]GHO83803.1 trehalose-6-phosphate synthase [Dictyobacter formicarum]